MCLRDRRHLTRGGGALRFIGERDLSAGNNGALRILNEAADGAVGGLRPEAGAESDTNGRQMKNSSHYHFC